MIKNYINKLLWVKTEEKEIIGNRDAQKSEMQLTTKMKKWPLLLPGLDKSKQ